MHEIAFGTWELQLLRPFLALWQMKTWLIRRWWEKAEGKQTRITDNGVGLFVDSLQLYLLILETTPGGLWLVRLWVLEVVLVISGETLLLNWGGGLVLMNRDVCMSLFLYRIIGLITTHRWVLQQVIFQVAPQICGWAALPRLCDSPITAFLDESKGKNKFSTLNDTRKMSDTLQAVGPITLTLQQLPAVNHSSLWKQMLPISHRFWGKKSSKKIN